MYQCKQCRARGQKKYCESGKSKAARKKRHQSFSGQTRHRLDAMRQRCNNPKHPGYARYGGRGIRCLFKNSNDLMTHVIVGLGVDNVSLLRDLVFHRIDNDGHYERGNVVLLLPAEHRRVHRELRNFLKNY